MARVVPSDVDTEVAALLEDGTTGRPLLIEHIPLSPSQAPATIRDVDYLRLAARERIELHCDKTSLIGEADRHITLRSTCFVSHAKIVPLDVSRDNSLHLPGRGLGLARVGSATNYRTAYATHPGARVFDGQGRNGHFTGAALSHDARAGHGDMGTW